MNPRELENRFIEKELVPRGFMSQKALFSIKHLPNGRIISNRSDFFGVWDIIALRNGSVFLFQVCSGTTYDDHVRKINENFPFTTNPLQVIVYYYKERSKWVYSLHVRQEVGWVVADASAVMS